MAAISEGTVRPGLQCFGSAWRAGTAFGPDQHEGCDAMSQESGGTRGHRRGACGAAAGIHRMKAGQLRAVTAGIACAAAAVAGCGGSVPAKPPRSVSRFLAAYARPDGRVVRPDQGGDTVSEGQAYGLVLAEAAGDDDAFRRIWSWTRDHLQLPDGLFAFHANAAGGLISRQPASDADVLIAWALLRYGGPGAAAAHRAGRRVADAVLTREVTTGPGRMPILTAASRRRSTGRMRSGRSPGSRRPAAQVRGHWPLAGGRCSARQTAPARSACTPTAACSTARPRRSPSSPRPPRPGRQVTAAPRASYSAARLPRSTRTPPTTAVPGLPSEPSC